jgi:hypothetical protein
LILSSEGKQFQVLYEFHPIGGVGDLTVLAAACRARHAERISVVAIVTRLYRREQSTRILIFMVP